MHLELVELLRCPTPHAPSVLVAAADHIVNRFVTEGLLGCPECHAEYAVRAGVTDFRIGLMDRTRVNDFPAQPVSASENTLQVSNNDPAADDDLSASMRLAAQLSLSAGRSVFALVGYDVAVAAELRAIVAARLLLINPFGDQTGTTLQRIASVAPFGVAFCDQGLPWAGGKFDGIAVSAAEVSATTLAQAAAALRTGGRLVAPYDAPLPAGLRELVRDDVVWVAERETVTSAPISLTRR